MHPPGRSFPPNRHLFTTGAGPPPASQSAIPRSFCLRLKDSPFRSSTYSLPKLVYMFKRTGLSLLSVLAILFSHAQKKSGDSLRVQTLNSVQVTSWSAGKKDNQLDAARSIGVV